MDGRGEAEGRRVSAGMNSGLCGQQKRETRGPGTLNGGNVVEVKPSFCSRQIKEAFERRPRGGPAELQAMLVPGCCVVFRRGWGGCTDTH